MTLMVAFYQDHAGTNDTYLDHAQRLATECEAVGQPIEIMPRNYGADYLSITRAKPLFMLEQLDRNGTIVYLDVDSHVLKPWDYPDSSSIRWAARSDGRPYGHVHYLPDNTATRAFLNAWLNTLDGWEGGDHSAMWLTIARTGLEWEALDGIEKRIQLGLAVNESKTNAMANLEAQGWANTIRQRLNS